MYWHVCSSIQTQVKNVILDFFLLFLGPQKQQLFILESVNQEKKQLCMCARKGTVESLSRRTSVVSLFMEPRSQTDSVTATLSEVVNLRQQSAARKLFKTLVTIHVNINKGGNDTAFPVPDKQNPSLCLLYTQPWYKLWHWWLLKWF